MNCENTKNQKDQTRQPGQIQGTFVSVQRCFGHFPKQKSSGKGPKWFWENDERPSATASESMDEANEWAKNNLATGCDAPFWSRVSAGGVRTFIVVLLKSSRPFWSVSIWKKLCKQSFTAPAWRSMDLCKWHGHECAGAYKCDSHIRGYLDTRRNSMLSKSVEAHLIQWQWLGICLAYAQTRGDLLTCSLAHHVFKDATMPSRLHF